jgi:hypothetical protein
MRERDLFERWASWGRVISPSNAYVLSESKPQLQRLCFWASPTVIMCPSALKRGLHAPFLGLVLEHERCEHADGRVSPTAARSTLQVTGTMLRLRRFRWPIIHVAEDDSVAVSGIHERQTRRSAVV